MSRFRLLFGINLLWFAYSVVSDGLTSLALPARLQGLVEPSRQASLLGILSFIGLAAGMVVQPLAGAWSDATRRRWGRRVPMALGVGLAIISLVGFALIPKPAPPGEPGQTGLMIAALAVSYIIIQAGLNLAQAAQQGYIPDLVPAGLRGRAAGLKGLLDMAGAMLGFVLLGKALGAGRFGEAAVLMSGLLAGSLLLTIWLVKERPSEEGAPRAAVPPNSAQDPMPAAAAARHIDDAQAEASDQRAVRRPPPRAQSIAGRLRSLFRLEDATSQIFKRLVGARFFFLLATYAVGRFLLYFVGHRLGLDPQRAAEQAGGLLAALALATALSAPVGGWLADLWGRPPLMLIGALLSAAGVVGLIWAASTTAILAFGLLMSLGSGAFAGANWAMTADLAPAQHAGRYFGLANVGSGAAAAAAGLFGPLMDAAGGFVPGGAYTVLFGGAALAYLLAGLIILPAAHSHNLAKTAAHANHFK